MAELTKALREVKDKLHENSVQVTVESLHVDQATLENLTFRLDSLDIQELSGSLNLGNNFGQMPNPGTKSTNQVRVDAGAPMRNRIERETKQQDNQADTGKDVRDRSNSTEKLIDEKAGGKIGGGIRETAKGYAVRF